jgi:hypothetical protein
MQAPEGAVAFNEAVRGVLNTNQKLTATFRPLQSGAEFWLPIVAASKHPDSTYEIILDGKTIYDEIIPPTDIDDLAQTFYPPPSFGNKLRVIIRYTGSSQRIFDIQPIGWEVQ